MSVVKFLASNPPSALYVLYAISLRSVTPEITPVKIAKHLQTESITISPMCLLSFVSFTSRRSHIFTMDYLQGAVKPRSVGAKTFGGGHSPSAPALAASLYTQIGLRR